MAHGTSCGILEKETWDQVGLQTMPAEPVPFKELVRRLRRSRDSA